MTCELAFSWISGESGPPARLPADSCALPIFCLGMSLRLGYFFFTIPAFQVCTRLSYFRSYDSYESESEINLTNCTRQLVDFSRRGLVLPKHELFENHLQKPFYQPRITLINSDRIAGHWSDVDTSINLNQGTVSFSLLVGTRAYISFKISRRTFLVSQLVKVVLRSLRRSRRWCLPHAQSDTLGMGKSNTASFALTKSMSLSYASPFSGVGFILRCGSGMCKLQGLGLRDGGASDFQTIACYYCECVPLFHGVWFVIVYLLFIFWL